MGSRLVLASLLLVACDARLHVGGATTDATSADSPFRANDDAPAIDAPAMLGPWGTPALIPGASDPALAEDDGTPNQALTELYFGVVNANTNKDLYWMQRATATDPWGPKTLLYQSANNDESPRLSLDELTLYFGRNGDIYQMTRAAVGQPWGTASIVPGVNVVGNNTYEKWLAVCQGGYYIVSRDADLYEGTLPNPPHEDHVAVDRWQRNLDLAVGRLQDRDVRAHADQRADRHLHLDARSGDRSVAGGDRPARLQHGDLQRRGSVDEQRHALVRVREQRCGHEGSLPLDALNPAGVTEDLRAVDGARGRRRPAGGEARVE